MPLFYYYIPSQIKVVQDMKEPSVHDSCTSIDSLVYKKGNGIFILIIQNSNILDFNTNDASWWSLYHILVVVIYSDL